MNKMPVNPPSWRNDTVLPLPNEVKANETLEEESYPFLPKSAGISPHFFVSHLKIGTVTGWVRSQFSARAMT